MVNKYIRVVRNHIQGWVSWCILLWHADSWHNLTLIIWIRIRFRSYIFCVQWCTIVTTLQFASLNTSNARCCTRTGGGGALLFAVTYDELKHIRWGWLAGHPCVRYVVIFSVPPMTCRWGYCWNCFIPASPDSHHIVDTPAVLLERVLWWRKCPRFALQFPTSSTKDIVA